MSDETRIANPYKSAILREWKAAQADIDSLRSILSRTRTALSTAWTGTSLADQTHQQVDGMALDLTALADGMEDEFSTAYNGQRSTVDSGSWQATWRNQVR